MRMVPIYVGLSPGGYSYHLRVQFSPYPKRAEWWNGTTNEFVEAIELTEVSFGQIIQTIRVSDMGKFLQRVEKTEKGKKGKSSVKDKETQEAYPALYEYMTTDQWEDGKERLTSTLLTFVENGVWKSCFTDREAGRRLWASAGTFMGLLAALEGLLRDPGADWRDVKPWEGGRKGKG